MAASSSSRGGRVRRLSTGGDGSLREAYVHIPLHASVMKAFHRDCQLTGRRCYRISRWMSVPNSMLEFSSKATSRTSLQAAESSQAASLGDCSSPFNTPCRRKAGNLIVQGPRGGKRRSPPLRKTSGRAAAVEFSPGLIVHILCGWLRRRVTRRCSTASITLTFAGHRLAAPATTISSLFPSAARYGFR